MERTLTDLCETLHNWFLVKPNGVHRGRFNIDGRTITCSFLQEGQYFRIKGSVFNDGVHQYPPNDLASEEFFGEVWAMAVPPDVIALLADIDAWNEKYGGIDSVVYSPLASESFNNYSYSKGSISRSNGADASTVMTWKDAFADKLRRWRKL